MIIHNFLYGEIKMPLDKHIEQDFSELIGQSQLERALEFIRLRFPPTEVFRIDDILKDLVAKGVKPSDLFSDEILSQWARDHGFTNPKDPPF